MKISVNFFLFKNIKMAKEVTQIFSEILERISPINFREKANIKVENQRLNEMHYLVPLIDEVKNVANAGMYGLCKHLNFIYLYNGAYWEQISSDELADF